MRLLMMSPSPGAAWPAHASQEILLSTFAIVPAESDGRPRLGLPLVPSVPLLGIDYHVTLDVACSDEQPCACTRLDLRASQGTLQAPSFGRDTSAIRLEPMQVRFSQALRLFTAATTTTTTTLSEKIAWGSHGRAPCSFWTARSRKARERAHEFTPPHRHPDQCRRHSGSTGSSSGRSNLCDATAALAVRSDPSCPSGRAPSWHALADRFVRPHYVWPFFSTPESSLHAGRCLETDEMHFSCLIVEQLSLLAGSRFVLQPVCGLSFLPSASAGLALTRTSRLTYATRFDGKYVPGGVTRGNPAGAGLDGDYRYLFKDFL